MAKSSGFPLAVFVRGSMSALATTPNIPSGKPASNPHPLEGVICPSGKTPFSKEDAKTLAQRMNGGSADPKRTRRAASTFRCGFCSHYHLGNRR